MEGAGKSTRSVGEESSVSEFVSGPPLSPQPAAPSVHVFAIEGSSGGPYEQYLEIGSSQFDGDLALEQRDPHSQTLPSFNAPIRPGHATSKLSSGAGIISTASMIDELVIDGVSIRGLRMTMVSQADSDDFRIAFDSPIVVQAREETFVIELWKSIPRRLEDIEAELKDSPDNLVGLNDGTLTFHVVKSITGPNRMPVPGNKLQLAGCDLSFGEVMAAPFARAACPLYFANVGAVKLRGRAAGTDSITKRR